ncbi:MAG: hypothetical protein KFW07_01170 [Mycoplasmataceae bacterium]|nr:hypothetical protein [Mycoplasmataceae bacterium]
MKLPIEQNTFGKLTLEQLIEIFVNIDKNFHNFLQEYISSQNSDLKYYENNKTFNIRLGNYIHAYCKENNITFKKHNDIFFKMHFDQEVVTGNKNENINFCFDEYKKIRDNQDENSLKKKSTLLSSLKNNMDHWISLRQNNSGQKINLDFQDKFFELKSNTIIDFMQSLTSHMGQTSNIAKYEDIKTSFKRIYIKRKTYNLWFSFWFYYFYAI